LDVLDGRVVKGIKFVQLRSAGDPPLLAKMYEEQGADEIVFLDIGASPQMRKTLADVVERTADTIFIPLAVGGGVRSIEDINLLLHAGADKVSVNTAAVENPTLVRRAAEKFGSQCIVVAIDAKRKDDGWEVYTYGGRRPTGINALEWAGEVEELGAGEILLTSMDADGTLLGYDLELTKRVSSSVRVPVIASGGAGKLEHLLSALTDGGADAALAASIFHYGDYTVQDVKVYLSQHGVPVRL